MEFKDAGGDDNHVERARRAIHTLHAAHDDAATPMDRAVDATTAVLGRPLALICVTVVMVVWIAGNLIAGSHALDIFPFPDLDFAISTGGLIIAILILAAQKRADRLADARERMTLELSLQSAQKVSKVIALLEELRRDTPSVPNRVDPEAADMAIPRTETEVLENTPIAQELGPG